MANEGVVTLNDLQTRFRAAGVYTVIRDQSASPNVRSLPIIRLVVGFSKDAKIINSPVYIEQGDVATFERIFGKRDKGLERKGSWFHKTCLISLLEGPIIAMALIKPNNEVDNNGVPTADADVVPYRSFSTDVADENGVNTDKLFASYFDKERFWQPSKSFLLATRASVDAGSILNLTNLSQAPISFIIRKSEVKGFDIPVKEWYQEIDADVPAYVNPNDLISDYFIDIIAISGDYSNYTQLSIDPVMGTYFDSNGLIISEIENFLARTEVKVIDIFTGCLITNFKNTNGVSEYIEEVVNRQTRLTGILCAVDRKELDKYEDETNTKFLDLVGHRLLTNTVNQTNFLSYKRKLAQDFPFTEDTTNATQALANAGGITVTANPADQLITVVVTNVNANFSVLHSGLEVGKLFLGETTAAGTTAGITLTNPVLEVSRVVKTATTVTFDVTSPLKSTETATSGSFIDLKVTGGNYTWETVRNRFYLDGTDTWLIADTEHPIYTAWEDGDITSGDKVISGGTPLYIKFTKKKATGGIDTADDYRDILHIELFTDADLTVPISAGAAYDFGTTEDSNGFAVTTATTWNIVSIVGSVNKRFDAVFIDNKTVTVDISFEAEIKKNDYLIGYDENNNLMLTRILNIVRVGSPTVTDIQITTANVIKEFASPSGSSSIERYKPIETFYSNYDITALSGFTVTTDHMPNNTNTRMKDIQSVMTDTNIYDALIDPEMINFRYYIDTWNHGLETGSKKQIARLLRDRQTCLGILNTPTVDEFRDSIDPRFTESPTAVDPLPSLKMTYIEEGGNSAENPTFLYTLPEEEDGASFCGFFFPNIVENDTDDFISIPPAGFVGNQFMKKYRGGNQFLPVAGQKRGTITGDNLVGLDYALTKEDRGALEAKGINPIYQRSTGEIIIYGNETAYKRYNSVLNNLHVRDMLITIQIDTENILNPFVFEFNEDTMKTEVISLLRNYFQSLKDGYGAITFYDIIFDRNNNPGFVVRENAAIVDTIVEPTGVAKKFINRITLRNSAPAASSGFAAI